MCPLLQKKRLYFRTPVIGNNFLPAHGIAQDGLALYTAHHKKLDNWLSRKVLVALIRRVSTAPYVSKFILSSKGYIIAFFKGKCYSLVCRAEKLQFSFFFFLFLRTRGTYPLQNNTRINWNNCLARHLNGPIEDQESLNHLLLKCRLGPTLRHTVQRKHRGTIALRAP